MKGKVETEDKEDAGTRKTRERCQQVPERMFEEFGLQ